MTQITEENITSYSPPTEGWSQTGVVKRNSQDYFSLPYNPNLRDRAKALRKAGNLAEVLFWQQVRKGNFKGYDFDRQKIIGNYIVDFYCGNCRTVIEIDGSSHDDKQDYDSKRDAYLESLGLTVIHITAKEVLQKLADVMSRLYIHPALKSSILPPRSSTTPPEEGNLERHLNHRLIGNMLTDK